MLATAEAACIVGGGMIVFTGCEEETTLADEVSVIGLYVTFVLVTGIFCPFLSSVSSFIERKTL